MQHPLHHANVPPTRASSSASCKIEVLSLAWTFGVLSNGFQSAVPGLAASALPGHLLEMQILCPQSQTNWLDGMAHVLPHSDACWTLRTSDLGLLLSLLSTLSIPVHEFFFLLFKILFMYF